ncbi:hypothetical protein V8C86DRAFT_2601350 [Haematococcus lacustris]
MTMGSMQCCLAAVMSLTMLLQCFLGQPTPGFPAAAPPQCSPPSPAASPSSVDIEDPNLLPQIKAAMDLLTNAGAPDAWPPPQPHQAVAR